MKTMPIIFAGHGSPMNAIEDSSFSRTWIDLGKQIPKPEAILAISAHWFTHGTKTQSDEDPEQIYDFYGFPKALYDVSYPAKGSGELSQAVQGLLKHQVVIDNTWGIDHGTWSVLNRMYPNADIPIVQLSIDADSSSEHKFELGRKLSALRDKGVLIFGSGNVVHNLARLDWHNPDNGYDWAKQFDDYISENALSRQFQKVIDYKQAGTSAKYAFTTTEHFDPLLYCLGATTENDSIKLFNQACTMGSLSMTGYLIESK